MELQFDFERSLQAAAYLLELEEGSMDYIRLLKLLYIAERELLAEQATPLTGDVFKALKYGPVMITIYDIIMDRSWRSAEWDRYIKMKNYSVRLAQDPGRDRLSPAIVGKLREVSDRYREMNNWDLVEVTREFPEWRKNAPPADPPGIIPLEDVLEAMGAEEGTLEAILEEEAIRRQMDDILRRSRERLAAASGAAS